MPGRLSDRLLVALLDSYAPVPVDQERRHREALSNVLASLPHWLRDLRQLERRQIMERLPRWLLIARRGHEAVTATDLLGDSAMDRLSPRQRAFVQAHYQAALAYSPRPYSGNVTLFRA